MGAQRESTVDLLKRALDEAFAGQSVSYVSFQDNRLRLNLQGFLLSKVGRAVLKDEIKAAQRVPWAPNRKSVGLI